MQRPAKNGSNNFICAAAASMHIISLFHASSSSELSFSEAPESMEGMDPSLSLTSCSSSAGAGARCIASLAPSISCK